MSDPDGHGTDIDERLLTRRRFVGGFTATAAIAVAGCSGDSGGTTSDGETGPGTATGAASVAAEPVVLSADSLATLELAETTREEFTFSLPSASGGN